MNAKEIIRYIWSAWSIFWFVIVMITILPFLMFAIFLGNQNLIIKAHFLPTYAARFLLFVWGIRVKVHNKNLIDPNGQYIYICNHRSYLDAILGGAVVPNFLKFLGKAEILHWPILGFLMKHFYVPVWRKDKAHRSWSMTEMQERIKTGCSFFICPEGTCNVGEEFFTRFYDGAFKLSIETKISIVPLTFINCGELMPRNNLLLMPGRVEVYWHQPILSDEINYDNIEEIKERVKNIMRKDLLLHHPTGKFNNQ